MFEIRNYLQIILVMIIRIYSSYYSLIRLIFSSITEILFSFENIIDMKSRKKYQRRFPLKNVVKRCSGVDANCKARCETSSMYQSRGKHARHGGNCANRIINTFRPLHYGCNERFLCTFPCADFAPLFARTCDRSMHSRAKIRIQGKDSTFTVINNDRWIRVSYL